MDSGEMRLSCPLCEHKTTDTDQQRCSQCSVGLEVHYPDFKARVDHLVWPPDLSLPLADRYAAFLPASAGSVPSLGEGTTPLFASERLAARTGCSAVFLDHEGLNPIGSFKDRGTLVALGHAASLGVKAVGAVSSGNMAASVAAYAARAGIPAVILVSDKVPLQKLRAVGVYGPLLVRVQRAHERLYFDSLELGAEFGIRFINSDDPFRIEGQKTAAMDICARLSVDPPTVLVVPLSSGGHLLSLRKGLRGLVAAGVLDRAPRIVGVQPSGCAPIHDAYARRLKSVERVEAPETIAGSICNPYPPGGDVVLAGLRADTPDVELSVLTVADEEMVEAQRELAEQEGLWVQPDSAGTVAALGQLAEAGLVDERDRVVCVLTGAGHRDPDTPDVDAVVDQPIAFDDLYGRVDEFLRSTDLAGEPAAVRS